MQLRIPDRDFHADNTQNGQNICTNVCTLSMRGKTRYRDLITILSQHPDIRTRNV